MNKASGAFAAVVQFFPFVSVSQMWLFKRPLVGWKDAGEVWWRGMTLSSLPCLMWVLLVVFCTTFVKYKKDNFLRWRRISSNRAQQQCARQKDSTQPSSFAAQWQLTWQLCWTISVFCLLTLLYSSLHRNKLKNREKMNSLWLSLRM